jgi:hypothetical protein
MYVFLPGTIQSFRNYGYDGLDIWIDGIMEELPNAKVYIGHSLGTSFILKANANRGSKFIFINPLIRKRMFLVHFINWTRFLIFEGFSIKKAVPFKYWHHTFKQVMSLLSVDVLEETRKIPNENIVIIRGKHGDYFYDKEAAKILKANKIKLIEVEAGHDWNKNIAKEVRIQLGLM